MNDPRDARIAELEAEIARMRENASKTCPFDAPDDPRANIEEEEACPVCGMLGTPGGEDLCVGGPRSCSTPRSPTGGEKP